MTTAGAAAGAARSRFVAPGAHDALLARLVEQAGFSPVHMTGFGGPALLTGFPEVACCPGPLATRRASSRPWTGDRRHRLRGHVHRADAVRAYEQAGRAR